MFEMIYYFPICRVTIISTFYVLHLHVLASRRVVMGGEVSVAKL